MRRVNQKASPATASGRELSERMAKWIVAGASLSAAIIAATRAKVEAGSSLQTGTSTQVRPRTGAADGGTRGVGQRPMRASIAPQASQAVERVSRAAETQAHAVSPAAEEYWMKSAAAPPPATSGTRTATVLSSTGGRVAVISRLRAAPGCGEKRAQRPERVDGLEPLLGHGQGRVGQGGGGKRRGGGDGALKSGRAGQVGGGHGFTHWKDQISDNLRPEPATCAVISTSAPGSDA